MAVRIREDRKTIVCAAKSEKMLGDVYLDDGVHYALSAELGVLRVIGQDENEAELWEFCSSNPHPYLPMTTPNSAREAAEKIDNKYSLSHKCLDRLSKSGEKITPEKEVEIYKRYQEQLTVIIEDVTRVGVKEEILKDMIKKEGLIQWTPDTEQSFVDRAKDALGDKPGKVTRTEKDAIREALLVLDDDVDEIDVKKAVGILRDALAGKPETPK